MKFDRLRGFLAVVLTLIGIGFKFMAEWFVWLGEKVAPRAWDE